MIRTRIYQDGQLVAEDCDPDLISDYLEDPRSVVWLDLESATGPELALLQEEFQLHPLAVEDATHAHQRPKIESYTHHVFGAFYAARLEGNDLVSSEVDIFLGRQFIITVRKEPAWPIEPVLKRWETGKPLLEHGVSFMLHALLDEAVDEYVDITLTLQDRLDSVEDHILEPNSHNDLQGDLFDLRRSVVGLRRIIHPLKDSFGPLLEGRFLEIPEDMKPYFQDVKDHLLRASDDLDALQELLVNAINLNLTVASKRLNDIMKQVTSWAAIIGVDTVVAGIYGMNFNLWPSGDNPWSFWYALGLMFVLSLVLYLYFHRKDWL